MDNHNDLGGTFIHHNPYYYNPYFLGHPMIRIPQFPGGTAMTHVVPQVSLGLRPLPQPVPGHFDCSSRLNTLLSREGRTVVEQLVMVKAKECG